MGVSPSSAFSINLEWANLNSPSSLCSSAAYFPKGGVRSRTFAAHDKQQQLAGIVPDNSSFGRCKAKTHEGLR